MPSFFPRSMANHQLPLTPPEYAPSYSGDNYSSMHYQQSYGQPAASLKSEGGYNYTDRRNIGAPYQTALPSMTYQAPTSYSNPAVSIARSSQYYGAPRLPPILPTTYPPPPTYEQAVAGDMSYQNRHDSIVRDNTQTHTKAEKPVGGVSATLDYDMETMTDFVAEMASGIIRLGAQQNIDPTFRKWVHQVLCATRLPSATILLSLLYLSMRMSQLSGRAHGQHDERQKMLIVALILGSKFLDDNTFINRSWSEVSGIPTKLLNDMEIEWFVAMDHRLHRDPKESQGFTSWLKHWKEYEHQVSVRKSATLKLSPLDTTGRYQKTARTSWSPMTAYGKQSYPRSQLSADAMQLDTPAYTPYDSAWLYPRSATDSSPGSAANTGPTTPEYYASPGINTPSWSGHEGYSRRTMFGFPPSHSGMPYSTLGHSQPLGQSQYYNRNAQTASGMQYLQSHSAHGMSCSCYSCVKSPTNYFLSHHGFGQAMPVAG